jgi:hypothetical protein
MYLHNGTMFNKFILNFGIWVSGLQTAVQERDVREELPRKST